MNVIVLVLALAFAQATTTSINLKFRHGGACFFSWCHTGWESSPAIGTLPGGQSVIVAGQYQVTAMLANATQLWKIDSPGPVNPSNRVWSDIVITEVDGAPGLEVVVSWSGGFVGVYDLVTGAPKFNSPVQVPGATNEFRGLAVADMDNDGKAEIALGLGLSSTVSMYLLSFDLQVLPGWPQLSSQTVGFSWGVYNDNVGFEDMDGDGQLEVVFPTDVTTTNVFHKNASPMPVPVGPWRGNPANWGHISQANDQAIELDNSNNCALGGWPSRSPMRINTADGPVTFADIDGDGAKEVIIVGRAYEWCQGGNEITKYNGMLIFNKNRTRFSSPIPAFSPYVWFDSPQPTQIGGAVNANFKNGPLLSLDFNVIQPANYHPVVGDIDGDGVLEILYAGFDGKLHCWWLDKSEKYNWPFTVGTPAAMAYSNPPVLVDIDNDGRSEIIIATLTAIAGVPSGCSQVTPVTCSWGEIIVLDFKGNVIARTQLVEPKECNFNPTGCATKWNGILGSLVAADVDGNGLLDIVGVTANSGVVRYELSNSMGFRPVWPTSRGNFQRTGQAPSTVRQAPRFPSVLGNGDGGGFLAPPGVTTVPPATTTAAAPITTVPGATTPAPTTAAPGPTTTRPTTTAGGPGPTTTRPLTTAGGGGGTTTTTVAGGGATTAACATRRCCTLGSVVPPGYERFTVRLNMDFPSFDCQAFLPTFCADRRINAAQVTVMSVTLGSVMFDAAIPTADLTAFINDVVAGASTLPTISLAARGTTVTPPAPFPWWIVLVAVLGGLLLIAAIIVVIIFVRRRRDKSSHYVALHDSEPAPAYSAPYVAAPAPAPAPSAGLISMRLAHDVVDKGEGILQAKRGQIAFVSPEDMAATSDWVWVMIGTQQGYVPRLFLERA